MNTPNLCEVCNIGQLNFVAKSNTGKDLTLFKCMVCDSNWKYENGLLILVSKGNTYKSLTSKESKTKQ